MDHSSHSMRDGLRPLSRKQAKRSLACRLKQSSPKPSGIFDDGISEDELALAPILAARTLVETDPDYARASARLLLDKLRREALTFVEGRPQQATQAEMARRYQEYFRAHVKSGIENELLDPEIGRFDLDRLAAALKPERDLQFDYLGLQTLYDRYFLHAAGTRFELPQAFFMRVACGVALREIDREERAIEFYDLLSSFDFMASTPTLFNAGTLRPQLSSCFLTTVPDDLDGIFKAIRDNALLSKYAGGLGNDWTRVRGLGAHIKWAISGSVDLAAERGRYPSFEGSLWSRGILPIHSIKIVDEARGSPIDLDRSSRLDWSSLRQRIATVGMRNSNTMAIAPTATISNICGVSQSIEPAYQNLYVKSNMSGDFTVVNAHLVRDLKVMGLWDEVMVSDLKYFDGSVGKIDRVPNDLKSLYATAFEMDSSWLIEAAARRQKWIDQAQSLNLYIANPSGKKLDALYRLAWKRGLKTTYYLRSRSATHVEKSTLKSTDGKLNAVSISALLSAATPGHADGNGEARATACAINDPTCEACQ